MAPRTKRPPTVSPTKHVAFRLDQLLNALKELEIVIQFLHRVGSFYDDPIECDQETIRILDEYRCVRRLAKARAILMSPIRQNVTEAELTAIEELLGTVKHWRKPIPPKANH